MKEEIVKYLRHVGKDYAEEDESIDTSPECEEPSDKDGCCPNHKNCGTCRYEYMKRKGWLSEEAGRSG